MKTLKIFSIGFLFCLALSTTSQAQVYVSVNAGGAPYGYYPPNGGYVQVYGGGGPGYYGGYNRGYVNPGYYRQPYYGGGYYRPHYGYGGGYGGRGHHRCY